MINAYDFDQTIYHGDSSVHFYLYCLRKNPKVLCAAPKQLSSVFLYLIRVHTKDQMKENIFEFLKYINDVDSYVEDFWKTHLKNIKEWYLKQKKDTDVIISASPEFLLKPLEKKLNVHVIATKVNKKTGRFESKNCHDYEKVKRYEDEFDKKIKEFYSDSIRADKALLEYAKEGYVVKKNKITKYEGK